MPDKKAEIRLSVSEFVAVVNQTFEYALPSVVIVGEISSYSVRQGKWVRFKLKDEDSSVDFFGSVFQIRQPLEDGMMVAVVGRPRLSDKWGFSVSVQSVQAVGEGSIKRSFELLLRKLEAEGLFDEARKRQLPEMPAQIGLISSVQAAGYADFLKILDERWGGMDVKVANTLVQGVYAPAQIIRAIEHFNASGEPPEVIVIVRGGGSADDLAAFNDEALVRAIAASRIPTLVGVGHEIDTTLADMAADKRAATPTNAAQLLVPDRRELIAESRHLLRSVISRTEYLIEERQTEIKRLLGDGVGHIERRLQTFVQDLSSVQQLIRQYDPTRVLARGYAVVRGKVEAGEIIRIERIKDTITAEVQDVRRK